MLDEWEKAADFLKKGGVVILPSESSYGIAALVSNKKAVEKLYKIKLRSNSKPSLAVVGSLDQAKTLVKFSPLSLKLAKKFWPGGLTLVLESKIESLPSMIYGDDRSLAVRVPSHKKLRNLALKIGPFILPSANLSGKKAPFKLSEIDKKLANKVDFIVKEQTSGNMFSTLVDARGKKPMILRQGSVTVE